MVLKQLYRLYTSKTLLHTQKTDFCKLGDVRQSISADEQAPSKLGFIKPSDIKEKSETQEIRNFNKPTVYKSTKRRKTRHKEIRIRKLHIGERKQI